MALIVSRLEGLREELATHTLMLLTREAAKTEVPEADLVKVVANQYEYLLRRAQETHDPKRSDRVKILQRSKRKKSD